MIHPGRAGAEVYYNMAIDYKNLIVAMALGIIICFQKIR